MARGGFDRVVPAILSPGEIVHARMRPRFADDVRRAFIGVVKAYEDGVARVEGHTWVFNARDGVYVPKQAQRVRLIPVSSGEFTVNVLPRTTQIEKVRYELAADRRLILTDGAALKMDVSEYRQRSM